MSDNPEDVPLSPAQRSRIRRLSRPKHVDESEEAGELNIVPFLDIVMNILMFVLATIPAVFTVTLETEPPGMGGGKVRASNKQSLNLSVVIVEAGVSVKATGGNVAPGCDSPGAGITVPKRGGKYDWAELNRCAKVLKNSSPDFAEEDTVQILADPGIDFQTVVSAMDAVRETKKKKPLFPKAQFGLVK